MLYRMYPMLTDIDFERKLCMKAEFIKCLNVGYLKPHQELVRRYMSPYTPYDRLLMYHSMGSGKSYIAISIAEDHYNILGRKCIILTKGSTSANNFKLQIRNWLKISHPNISDKDIKLHITQRYIISHYMIFCKTKLLKNIDPDIRNNIVLIIDEVHNINYSRDSIYDSLRSYIRTLTNSKVLLLSGTPMTNDISRIMSITEMILPEYIAPDIIKNSDEFYKVIKGYISYYDIDRYMVNVNYIGHKVDEFYLPLYISKMLGIQHKVYIDNIRNDNIYVNQTHISLFVFSDGTYGSEAFKGKIRLVKTNVPYFVGAYNRDKKYSYCYDRYMVVKEFSKDIKYNSLQYNSCKYYTIITEINKRYNQLCFIFCRDIRGSGLILLSCILESMGYELYYGQNIEDIQPKPRYTICVGVSSISPNNKDRIAGFNHYLNRQGDYVKIMLGSSVTGECISLFNVRHLHCISPHWNTSYIDQVIKRAVRTGSHDMLDVTDRTIDVYIHISIVDSNIHTVDIRKMIISDSKELELEPIRNILRNSSIESILVKHRYDNIDLDCTTYINYITDNILGKYIHIISQHIIFPIHIRDISIRLSMPIYLVERIISYMIMNNTCVRDYYGRISYVREASGLITLSRDYRSNRVTIDSSTLIILYKESYIYNKHVDIDRFISDNEYLHPMLILKSMHSVDWSSRISILERSISINSNICIPYDLYIIRHNSIYHIYEYRKPINGNYSSSSRGFKAEGYTRVLRNGVWAYATAEDEILALAIYESKINNIEKNNNNIIYICSSIDLILRVSITEYNIIDRRRIKRGKNIYSLSRQDLLICYNTLYDDDGNELSSDRLIHKIITKVIELDIIIYM